METRRPRSSPDLRIAFSARWLLLVAAVAPVGFIAWVSLLSYRDAPFWDEFATTLKFLSDLHDSASWGETLRLFVAGSNQHCMITTRLITAGIYLLTGKINFIALAAIGHLAIACACVVLAWQPRQLNARFFYGALLGLLIFQLQHFENQILSYAAIDHYQVVLWVAVSLALLGLGGRLAGVAGGAAAVAAVFTVAQGLAVFPAGAWLLWHQRRRRALAWWAVLGAGVAGLFAVSVSVAAPAGASLASVAGWLAAGRYWLALLGSVPGLEHPVLAPAFGAAGLAWFGLLAGWGALRREPVLGAFLIATLGATLLIAYGRFTLGVPQIAPRYFVQSALFWATLPVIALRAPGAPARFWRLALPVTLGAAAFSVVASARYGPVAEQFFRQRLETIRYYDKWLTLAGAPHPIYPDSAAADRILQAAERRGIFRLQARSSPPIARRLPVAERAMHYYLDEQELGDRRLHIRGWMLPPEDLRGDYRPYLVLGAGEREFVFRGQRQRRPDVAAAHDRPDAVNSGFIFVIRRLELPPTELKISLQWRSERGGVFTRTDHRVDNQPNFAATSLDKIHPNLTEPARQIFLGVLP